MSVYATIRERLAGIGVDKYIHFGACQLLAWAVSKTVEAFLPQPYALMAGFATALAVGLGKEFYDRRQPGNRFDWLDIKADVLGACVGAIMSL